MKKYIFNVYFINYIYECFNIYIYAYVRFYLYKRML